MNLASSELKVKKKINDLNVFQNQEIDMRNCDLKRLYLPNRD